MNSYDKEGYAEIRAEVEARLRWLFDARPEALSRNNGLTHRVDGAEVVSVIVIMIQEAVERERTKEGR